MSLWKREPVIWSQSACRVALVTGLSDAGSCELSRDQRSLMDSLELPDEWKVWRNFPFVESRPLRDVSLARASLANTAQFVAAGLGLLREHRLRHWRALVESTEWLLLITGSCGLELVRDLERLEKHRAVAILALGPVAWRRPRVAMEMIQGERDLVSRLWMGKVGSGGLRAGHMECWSDPQVRELVKRWLCDRISGLPGAAAACPSGG